MADVKHTPGPWFADADECEIFSPSANGRVAMVGERPDIETERANARLIAAAPDLLAACIAILPHIKWATDCDPAINEQVSRDFNAARAAISKATGEA